MLEIVKKCRRHGDLNIEQVKLYARGEGYEYRCIQCTKEDEAKRPKRKYEGKFADYHREYAKEWRRKNSDMMNARISEDRKNNPEKYREYDRKGRNKDLERSRYMDVLHKHKISAAEYDQIIVLHNNLCAICGKSETKKSRTPGQVCRLCIDHDHITSYVRGLLCHNCNAGIGYFKDNINTLNLAIDYLKSHTHKDQLPN